MFGPRACAGTDQLAEPRRVDEPGVAQVDHDRRRALLLDRRELLGELLAGADVEVAGEHDRDPIGVAALDGHA